MQQQIQNVVLVMGHDHGDPYYVSEVSFTIRGPPVAQNGWKLAWKSRQKPVLFDPLQAQKRQLRANVRNSLIELLMTARPRAFPIFRGCGVRIHLTFCLHIIEAKDVDNMMKYIFDAMQDVLYRNDASIMVAIVEKVKVRHNEVESTILRISRAADHTEGGNNQNV